MSISGTVVMAFLLVAALLSSGMGYEEAGKAFAAFAAGFAKFGSNEEAAAALGRQHCQQQQPGADVGEAVVEGEDKGQHRMDHQLVIHGKAGTMENMDDREVKEEQNSGLHQLPRPTTAGMGASWGGALKVQMYWPGRPTWAWRLLCLPARRT